MSFKLRYYFNWVYFIRALATKPEGMACLAQHFLPMCLVSLLCAVECEQPSAAVMWSVVTEIPVPKKDR